MAKKTVAHARDISLQELVLRSFLFPEDMITPNFTYFLLNHFLSLIDRLALRQSLTEFS